MPPKHLEKNRRFLHHVLSVLRFSMSDGDLFSVDYEVFGKVQGVFFRKYTQAQGKKLGLVGWVQNTGSGTVQGQLQGQRKKVKEMQEWLKTTGSPKSHIIKAEFKNEKAVSSLEHSTFTIVK
ncbi:acylphosphatase-1 isoform X1 [Nerophis lumbriciformis]|uniref:acylphosphatase-1 isoform X1 n=2 Tax=Nerophis TaxID=159076 RepID=UPI002AE043AA|nr:acylphosphatase-1-like isoform X1 [Nerophis lumbriciformis]